MLLNTNPRLHDELREFLGDLLEDIIGVVANILNVAVPNSERISLC